MWRICWRRCRYTWREVRRNPYHLRMPAWMMDNVRRGAELVGGQGSPAPDFCFCDLVSRCSDGKTAV